MAVGIRDRVAIIGMGCTRFGEHFDKSTDDLLVEAVCDALDDAGVRSEQVDAYWLSTLASGFSGLTLSGPLKLQYKPVTRVENYCASGSEAFRQACYAVAAGICDVAVAVGVEKMKDAPTSGIALSLAPSDGAAVDITAPAAFSFLAPAYFARYGVDPAEGKRTLARIAWKNHKNGAANPRAQFRKEVSMDEVLGSPIVAAPLSIMDCSGVADGSAAAVIVRAEDAHKYRSDPVYVKAISVVAGPGTGGLYPEFDFTSIPETVEAARRAYAEAGITDPRRQLSMAEVHYCFTPTALVLMEDLGFSDRGHAWQDVLNGVFDLDGALPVNPDGGLKSFGHPIGASGIRMLFEAWLQLRGQAGPRQIPSARLALTHNLGGLPWHCVVACCVVGKEPGPP